MIIAKHKKTNSIYIVFCTGKQKMENGEWEDSVFYKRLSIDLKDNESVSELYSRTKQSFREDFEHIKMEDFKNKYGHDFKFPYMEGNFSGIFY